MAKKTQMSGTFTCGDTGQILSNISAPLIFVIIDCQIQTNAVDYGDVNGQHIELNVGDILSYDTERGVDLRELFFANHTAGQNGVVAWAGVLKE